MAVTKKTVVGKNTKKPAKKSSSKPTKPTSAAKLHTTIYL